MTVEPGRNVGASEKLTAPALRPWQRLGVKLALAFALLALVTVGLVGALVYERQKREVEDTVGTQLLNIARTAVLLVDPAVHADAQAAMSRDSPAYARIKKALVAVADRDVAHHSHQDLDRLRSRATLGQARRRGRRLGFAGRDGGGRAGDDRAARLDVRGRCGTLHAYLPQRERRVDHRDRPDRGQEGPHDRRAQHGLPGRSLLRAAARAPDHDRAGLGRRGHRRTDPGFARRSPPDAPDQRAHRRRRARRRGRSRARSLPCAHATRSVS